jgi:hypothetical protein
MSGPDCEHLDITRTDDGAECNDCGAELDADDIDDLYGGREHAVDSDCDHCNIDTAGDGAVCSDCGAEVDYDDWLEMARDA